MLNLRVISEESVDFDCMSRIGGVDCAENVDVDCVLAQAVSTTQRVVETTLIVFVHTIDVMENPWTVKADSNPIMILVEKSRPFVVDQREVGLDGVPNARMRLTAFAR